MINHKPKCTLCDSDAITCSARIPTCAQHDAEYQVEARQYLKLWERPFFQRLIAAHEQVTGRNYMGRDEPLGNAEKALIEQDRPRQQELIVQQIKGMRVP